jgi:hypothetical protein
VVRRRDQSAAAGETDLAQMSVRERMVMFTEGPRGPEPLWLWLTQNGLPFRIDSWEGVFREANARCARVLTPARGRDWDRTRSTPHMPHRTPSRAQLCPLHADPCSIRTRLHWPKT